MKWLLYIPLKIILLALWIPLLILSISILLFYDTLNIYLVGKWYQDVDQAEYWNLPEIIINKLSNLKLKQMKIKYLFQALKFACLPTISVLLLIICGFFSISKALDWISSDSGWAIALRILLVIGEIALVAVMYFNYEEEGEKLEKERIRRETINNNEANGEAAFIGSSRSVYEIWGGGSYNDTFTKYTTKDPNIVLIERIPKQK